ncbi:hypothetical protein BSNK01_05250 [Bacillaceae bacterium]
MADYTLRVGEPLTIDLRDHLPEDATVQFYEVQPVEMAVCVYAERLDFQSFFASLRDPVAGNDPGIKSSGSLPPFASLLDELRQGGPMAEEWMEDEEMEE